MSVFQGLKDYYDALGVRGVLAVSAYRLVGGPKEITARPAGIRCPVHLPVRTTDVSVYREILLRREYAFDLPFTPRTIVDVGANVGMASIFYASQ